MEEPFFTFRKFNDPELAAGMAGKLKEHGIPVELEDTENLFDPSFARNYLQREIQLKLRTRDFTEADRILLSFYRQQAELVGPEYYLFQFTDLELVQIVRNPDEWGYLDYALAQKILKEHGISIPSGELKRFHDEKIELLSRPRPSDKSLMLAGYVLALIVAPLGIITGFSMAYTKKTLPDGQRLFTYNDSDRKDGKRILILGCVCLLLYIGIWLWFWKR